MDFKFTINFKMCKICTTSVDLVTMEEAATKAPSRDDPF